MMTYYPKQPFVFIICIIGIVVGYYQEYLGNENFLMQLKTQHPQLSLTFFNFPKIGLRSTMDLLSDIQFYTDVVTLCMIIVLESMVCWGMLGVHCDQPYTSQV